jgi:hypothetical protein
MAAVIGTCEPADGEDRTQPGDRARMTITLCVPAVREDGGRFVLREDSQTFGAGTVTRVHAKDASYLVIDAIAYTYADHAAAYDRPARDRRRVRPRRAGPPVARPPLQRGLGPAWRAGVPPVCPELVVEFIAVTSTDAGRYRYRHP